MIDTEALVQTWLRAAGLRRPCVPVRYPGRLYRRPARGPAAPPTPLPQGEITWHDYLLPPEAILSS